jgi:mRNA interferase MazF
MIYSRGDIVSVSAKGNEGKPRPCIIVQANWLNEKSPPSFIVCLLTSEVHEELDFRPIITPDEFNHLEKISQVMTDKIQAVRAIQIGKKIGVISSVCLYEIETSLKILINL